MRKVHFGVSGCSSEPGSVGSGVSGSGDMHHERRLHEEEGEVGDVAEQVGVYVKKMFA